MTTTKSRPASTPTTETKQPRMNETSSNKLLQPSASYSLTLRLKIRNIPGMLGKITSLIGDTGADIGAIDIQGFEKGYIVRDLTVKVRDQAHGEEVVKALKA